MSIPQVELHVRDLHPDALHVADGRRLGDLDQAISAALMSYRMLVINHVQAQLIALPTVTADKLLNAVDQAAGLFLPKYYKIIGPHVAAAYLRAYRRADAGDVPVEVLYALAQHHSEQTGEYFNETSRDAVVRGFNAFVNRKVPAKAAAEQAMAAYGLTPRAINGVVAISPEGKILSAQPRNLKAKINEYIGRSLRNRFRIFSTQEAHNIDSQAAQTAWLWLGQHGRITETAQKVWITARDERTCAQCAPMHNVRVGYNDRFTLPNGAQLYVPGAHVNCRCVVRLLDTPVSKADWDPKEHPRGGDPENRGRFSAVARSKPKPVTEAERKDLSALQRFLDTATTEEKELITEEPEQQTWTSTAPWKSTQKAQPVEFTSTAAWTSSAPAASAEPWASTAVNEDWKSMAFQEPWTSAGVQPQPKPRGGLAPEDKFVQLHPDGHPYWAVIHESEYDTDMVLQGKRFTNSRAEAESIVAEMREDRIGEILDRVTGTHRDRPVRVTGYDPDTNEKMYGQVSAQSYEWALRRVANLSRPDYEFDDLEGIDEDYEDVVWTNAAGHRVSEEFPYISMADLVKQSGVTSQEFVFRILETTHGFKVGTRAVGKHKFDLSGQFVEAGPTTMTMDMEGKEVPVTLIKPYE